MMDRLAQQIARQKRVRARIEAPVVPNDAMVAEQRFREENALYISVLQEDKSKQLAEIDRLNRCLRVIRAHSERGTLTVDIVNRAIGGERL